MIEPDVSISFLRQAADMKAVKKLFTVPLQVHPVKIAVTAAREDPKAVLPAATEKMAGGLSSATAERPRQRQCLLYMLKR